MSVLSEFQTKNFRIGELDKCMCDLHKPLILELKCNESATNATKTLNEEPDIETDKPKEITLLQMWVPSD